MKSFKNNESKRLTLRLPENVLEVLKNESDKKLLPLNAIISRILSNYINFDIKKDILPTITMSQALLYKMIKKLAGSEMKKLALQGPKTVRNLFAMLNLKYTVQNVIENYFILVGRYAGWYTFDYFLNGNQYRLVFKSELGEEWINFLSFYLRAILESLKVKIKNETIDDSVIIFEFINDTN